MQLEGVLTLPLAGLTSYIPLWNEKKTISLGVPHHFSPHFFTPSLSHPHSFTFSPSPSLPHYPTLIPFTSLLLSPSLSLSLPHPLIPTPYHSLALLLLPESWLEVSQQGVEGALGHSHSQEEMEQLLAAAVSDEELSDSDFT